VNVINRVRLLHFTLLLLSLLALQLILVSASIGLAKSGDNLDADNTWLKIAKTLSFSNPDVLALEARALRSSAISNWESPGIAQLYLEQSLNAWQQAISLRPLWPYYYLAAFDIEVLQNADASIIQRRFDKIINHAPNERGMDKSLLALALQSWPKLQLGQKDWVVARLAIVPRRTLNFLYQSAEAVGREQLLCTFLPWSKVERYCSG
jgi:hypothetical protein